ncbi:hypothetical protein [Chryseobacterium gregarium]|uniref:hypothetical protein n=1 Tax=Chryseobacterium gregarium TaxID=456299 RepID=UPI000411BE4C|nr:hypothetical protein [Chryseobacterium gregarium]
MQNILNSKNLSKTCYWDIRNGIINTGTDIRGTKGQVINFGSNEDTSFYSLKIWNSF